jgi:hypothetical protein
MTPLYATTPISGEKYISAGRVTASVESDRGCHFSSQESPLGDSCVFGAWIELTMDYFWAFWTVFDL